MMIYIKFIFSICLIGLLFGCSSTPIVSNYSIGISKTEFNNSNISNGFYNAVLGINVFAGKYHGFGIGLSRTYIREIIFDREQKQEFFNYSKIHNENENDILIKEQILINSILLNDLLKYHISLTNK